MDDEKIMAIRNLLKNIIIYSIHFNNIQQKISICFFKL
jgi:hypothetical protein